MKNKILLSEFVRFYKEILETIREGPFRSTVVGETHGVFFSLFGKTYFCWSARKRDFQDGLVFMNVPWYAELVTPPKVLKVEYKLYKKVV